MSRSRVWRWAPAVAYMAFIFFSSSQSDPAPVLTQNVWDKLLHGAGYGVLALLYVYALTPGKAKMRVALAALALTSLYAASDEVHQRFTAGRNPEVRDWIADTTGGAIAVAGYVFSTVSRPRRRPPR